MGNGIGVYQSAITDMKEIISSGKEKACNADNREMELACRHIGKLA